ncbi:MULTISPECIES: Na+/H+ antiporter NhaA [unclassified Salinibacterium]|uniref:Na+/H+ antiporter NhaA n=1 Tax=unclassified Salinibacterium TaxID=2632331 RepID=UPI0027D9D821|nr:MULTISPECIES: Na+/H+ antiporter NhaA [unclassified Salinibacterium]
MSATPLTNLNVWNFVTTSVKKLSPRKRVRRWVTMETTSGVLLMVAAAIALIWANSPWRDGYAALAETTIGPEALHLNLSLATWAADGLLAIFFFVVGVELKQELVAGSLRKPREAAVPVFAAIGGMLFPALLFTLIILVSGDSTALGGWAIPTATDIAFALAVLAIFGRGLPRALRTFLLTMAVVDDLLAIIIIALFYTESIDLLSLLFSLIAIVLFGFVVRSRKPRWWLLVPLALVAWAFMHDSGVHATIAGVVLGFTVPAKLIHGEKDTRTHAFDDAVRPTSSGIALPVFAFFAAGVSLGGDGESVSDVIVQPVVAAIIVGLVVGKIIGVLGTTALITKVTKFRLADSIGLRDLLPIGFLTGIGFTVSLLIAELSFPDSEHTTGAKLAILIGTGLAAILAAISLRWDSRLARKRDMNEDGIPDRNKALIEDED